MKNNKICKICGKSYYYCYSCDEARSGKAGFEPWHILVHDENCKMIFDTLQKHFLKECTSGEAKKILTDCDLTIVTEKNAKAQIEEIMKAETKVTATATNTNQDKKFQQNPNWKKNAKSVQSN